MRSLEGLAGSFFFFGFTPPPRRKNQAAPFFLLSLSAECRLGRRDA